MESVRVDPRLTAWRASCITDGEMKLLKTSLEKQAKAVDNEAKIAGSHSPAFILWRQENRHYHVFYFWLRSCQLIKEGDMLLASRCAIYHFLGNGEQTRGATISVMNFVDILTVHCTTLFTVITYLDFLNQKKLFGFIVLLMYQHSLQIFDDCNCYNKSNKWILSVCVEEVRKRKTRNGLKILKSQCQKLLWTALKIILGHYVQSPFPPLSYAMRQTKPLESGAARHLLILASTIFGNLILTDTQPTEDIDGYRKRFCGILRKSLNQQQSVPEYVKRACSFFESPNATRQIFPLIQNLLLVGDPKNHAPLAKLGFKSNQVTFEPIQRKTTEKSGEYSYTSRSPQPPVATTIPQATSFSSYASATAHTSEQESIEGMPSGINPVLAQSSTSHQARPKKDHPTSYSLQQQAPLQPEVGSIGGITQPSFHAVKDNFPTQTPTPSSAFPASATENQESFAGTVRSDTSQLPAAHTQPSMTAEPSIIVRASPDPHQQTPTQVQETKPSPVVSLGAEKFPQSSQPLQPIQVDPPQTEFSHATTVTSNVTQTEQTSAEVGDSETVADSHFYTPPESPPIEQQLSRGRFIETESFRYELGKRVSAGNTAGYADDGSYEPEDERDREFEELADFDQKEDLNDALIGNPPGIEETEEATTGHGKLADDSLVDKTFCSVCGIPLRDEVIAHADDEVVEDDPVTPEVETDLTVETHQSHMSSQSHQENEKLYEMFHETLESHCNPIMQDFTMILRKCELLHIPFLARLIDDMTDEKHHNERRIDELQSKYAWRAGIQEMGEMVERMQFLLSRAEKEYNRHKPAEQAVKVTQGQSAPQEPAKDQDGESDDELISIEEDHVMDFELTQKARSKEDKEHSREVKKRKKRKKGKG